MGINKFNAEGYYDPTAYEAMTNIIKEEKAFFAFRPVVYICSPYQATLRSTVDNAEDVLVRYRAAEMCLLIDEIGKINEFSYPLMLKTLDRVVVNANGKLTFIFQSGIKITV